MDVTRISKVFLNKMIEMLSGLNFISDMNIGLVFQCPHGDRWGFVTVWMHPQMNATCIML